ncbi:hypothetical protein L1049_009846 [Liquidambar formosana]|uniref:PB1 domain-containing protein n=1 Tax=Liquidambar formosana TaxID=63359 RepID=A0AAP0R3S8_LIQFO
MTSHQPSELDNGTTESVNSSPRSDAPSHDMQPRVRFMCSSGGKILPRPHDNQLRYVGGDTRMVVVHRHTTFAALLNKLSKISGTANINIKYQLPNEDLDALISVTTDEDVENMMEEYERLAHSLGSKTARLRLFLFPNIPTGNDSRSSSISSLLDGSSRRENWFFDALNGGAAAELERGRSEVSSIFSEAPDYLFGLDTSDETQLREPKPKTRNALPENVSVSDPGSPAPVISSPFCSTSSQHCVPPIPDLPHVKTKPDDAVSVVGLKENQIEGFVETGEIPVSQPAAIAGNPTWHYLPDSHYPVASVQPMPVYYVSGPAPPGNVPVQPVPIQASYVQQFPAPVGQIPVGFHQPVPGVGQMYSGGMRPVAALDPYDMRARVVPAMVNQQMYYGVRNAGMVPVYPGMVAPGGEELQGSGADPRTGQASQ